ncbi:MAG: hypothetical protein Q8Q56_04390 [Alphaproteobacteria bacterium]|nr:hypothetical protein [Alphaproteobacteria bacterium]
MTQIYTFLGYEDIDDCYIYKGIYRPLSSLTTEELEKVIYDEVCTLRPNEVVGFFSFLNMVYQTHPFDNVQIRAIKDLGILLKKDLSNYFNNKVLLHRDMLLYLINEVIRGEHRGIQGCTGKGNGSGSKKLYELFLLTNTRLSRDLDETNLLLQLLRNNPQPYNLGVTVNYYHRWIVRYRYVYTELLRRLYKQENLITKGLKLIEDDMNVNLEEYFEVVEAFLNWFLLDPYLRKSEPNYVRNGGFNPSNINTFYINKENFSQDGKILRLIDKLSLSLADMKTFIQEACEEEKNRREFDPFFQRMMKLFHRPIFKVDENTYCIIDFKFFLEGLCSGLIWRLQPLLEQDNQDNKDSKLQNLRSEYGQLLEKYFLELIHNIFSQSTEHLGNGEGEPDAIVRSDDYTLIFEFTVEYYTIESLYSTKADKVRKKLDQLLFNKGGNQNKNKKQPGKLINLNKYIEKELPHNPDATIIPILVTERYLGDSALLTKFSDDIENRIKTYPLSCLEKYPLLIISLDELEIFWQFASDDPVEAIQEFVKCVEAWQNENSKGNYLFNFGGFVHKFFEGKKEKNKVFIEFFQKNQQINTNVLE